MTRRAPLLIATDASLSDHSGTLAMVDSTGRYAVASVFPPTNKSQVAEATAVLAALQSAPTSRPVHLLTDSLNTVSLVHTAVRVGFPQSTDERFTLATAIVRAARARRSSTALHWVKAHNAGTGVSVLQRSADRLARAAGRGNTAEFQQKTMQFHTTEMQQAIAAVPREARTCSCGWVTPAAPAGHDPERLAVTLQPDHQKATA